jgi:hypothetical protein
MVTSLAAVFFFFVNTSWVQGLVPLHSSVSRHSPKQHIHELSAAKIDTDVKPKWSLEQLEDFAADTGVELSFTTLGPGYRAVARAKYDPSIILGYVEGFVRPTGKILHLDKMEVFKPQVKKAKNERPDSFDFGGISFGIGLVLGYRCLLHGT